MSPVRAFTLRRLAAVGLALGLLAGCSSAEDDAASTTAVTTTTLPPSSTTTTIPPRAVTEVDVCALLREVDLERVLEDAGVGEAPPADERDPDAGVPAFVTGQCAWPSLEDPALILHYLAPTTAPDGPAHLTDVLETGTGFAEGGTVITQPVEGETVGILVDDEQMVRELAVVKRSALLYFLVNDEVSARDTAAVTEYAEILYSALVRAPR
jgi:hypothetical protein